MSSTPKIVCACRSGVVMTTPIERITSASNPLIKELRKLSTDNTAYRKQGRVWLEGDHLCRAALLRGFKPALGLFSESFWGSGQSVWAQAAIKNIVLPDALLAQISGLESAPSMGFVMDLPAQPMLKPTAASLILDRVQDAGNHARQPVRSAAPGAPATHALIRIRTGLSRLNGPSATPSDRADVPVRASPHAPRDASQGTDDVRCRW